jgi:hypothetical protein
MTVIITITITITTILFLLLLLLLLLHHHLLNYPSSPVGGPLQPLPRSRSANPAGARRGSAASLPTLIVVRTAAYPVLSCRVDSHLVGAKFLLSLGGYLLCRALLRLGADFGGA